MISAQVKGIYTIDMDDLEKAVPNDPERFCVVVRVMAGPRGSDGEESFDVKVCSPKWLEERVNKDGFVLGTHHLFVAEYDPAQIKRILTKLVERITGESWKEVALKIARIGYWE